MIKKLKRRYLITNMILLSCTLLIALGILFAVLYRSQIQSSYMNRSFPIRQQKGSRHRQ